MTAMTHQSPPDELLITRPDDWHLHLRDEAALSAVAPASAAQFARAVVMPNLRPPVATTAAALAYRERILEALGKSPGFEPLMTLYLTDLTSPDEIRRARASGKIVGVKLYPSGATTNSESGVSRIDKVYGVLEAMQSADLPLLIHGEVVDPKVDTFDKEAVFIERILIPLRERFPALRMVLEHITTQQAASYVTAVAEADSKARAGARPLLGATITPQHLLYNRNAIFSGGIRPHYYCLPILKREEHRLALVKAATSGLPAFFLGTDSAPHAAHLKEHAAGCAGCYTAPHAMELYATAFEQAGALDRLEAFASFYGADFYGLPRNTGKVRLRRESWTIPEALPFGQNQIVPLAAGETLHWKLV